MLNWRVTGTKGRYKGWQGSGGQEVMGDGKLEAWWAVGNWRIKG